MSNIYQFDNFLKNSVRECSDIPGLALAIFNSDNILYKYVHGLSNLKTKKKLKIDDKFCTASCGKSVLCAAIYS